MTDRVWDASVNKKNQTIRKLGGKNQPMTDRVCAAGVNKKINQSESLAEKPGND